VTTAVSFFCIASAFFDTTTVVATATPLGVTPFPLFLAFFPTGVPLGSSICRLAWRIIDDVPCRVLKILLQTEHLAESTTPSRWPLLDMGVKVSHTTLVSFFLRTTGSSSKVGGRGGITSAERLDCSSAAASILPSCAGMGALAQLCSSSVILVCP
jgi:hypothetical protein